MPVMTTHPQPAHLVPACGDAEALPQILILDRRAACGFPATPLPARQPLTDAFLHVLRVGMQHYLTRRTQRLKRLDGSHQLHPVVGGVRFLAAQLALATIAAQQNAPATEPRLAQAS